MQHVVIRGVLSSGSVKEDYILSTSTHPTQKYKGHPHMFLHVSPSDHNQANYQMRVLSANVAGINSTPKMHYFFTLAKRMNAMVTLFQEVKLKHEDIRILKLKWGSE